VELSLDGISEPFISFIEPLRALEVRSEFNVLQIPAPKGIAPESLAVSIEVSHDLPVDHGVSRLVFCRDDSSPEGWHGTYRVIGYAKSAVELEMARDVYFEELPWQWLLESLRRVGAGLSHEAGTTTTVISTGHGNLAAQPQHAEVEIRASWSPNGGDARQHTLGWIETLAMLSGLSPEDSIVTRLK
jgi:hypothetical protein